MYVITLDPDFPEYLEHFGVLGMHWGVRNAETQRKYDGGQKHNEARTDIAKPTKNHAYKGEFKPTLSKDQTKMLKRAAAGVAIGAGLAAGVAVGAKSGVLKSVAKNGARKLKDSAHLQERGKEFAQRVRTASMRLGTNPGYAKSLKQKALSRKADISSTVQRKMRNISVKTAPARAAASKRATQLSRKAQNTKAGKTMADANRKANYYLNDPKGRKKARNRMVIGATGAAFVSAPVIEGRSVDSRELRRKNGRHASTKWMRSKDRLS